MFIIFYIKIQEDFYFLSIALLLTKKSTKIIGTYEPLKNVIIERSWEQGLVLYPIPGKGWNHSLKNFRKTL